MSGTCSGGQGSGGREALRGDIPGRARAFCLDITGVVEERYLINAEGDQRSSVGVLPKRT